MIQTPSITTPPLSTHGQEWQSGSDTTLFRSKETLRELQLLSTDDILKGLNNSTAMPQTVNTLPIGLNKTGRHNHAMSAEVKAELVQALSNPQQGNDMDTIDLAVAGVASLYGAQLMSGKNLTTDNENRKNPTTWVSDVTQPTRSRSALEGGTDITAPSATGALYSNVLGNASVLHAFIGIMKALNQQEAHANMRAAQWSQNIMSSAQATGNNLINAAQERRTGALAGGITGLAMSGVATGLTLKSVRAQMKSINGNVSRATGVEKNVRATQRELKATKDTMVQNNDPMNPEVGSSAIRKHPEMQNSSETMRNNHALMLQESAKARAYSECLVHGSRVTHDSIDRSFDVSSSTKSKAAEMTRANQGVSGEVDNAHLQTGKRASEGESALRQSLLAILSHNNEAVAAVASRMG